MPPKTSQKGRKHRGQGKNRVCDSVIVSSISTAAGNTATAKNFTLAQIIPDITPSRSVVLQSVNVQFASSSAAAPSAGGMAQACLLDEPWASGGVSGDSAFYASMDFKSLGGSTTTTMSVVPRHPGQRQPVALHRGGVALQVQAYSFLAGTWQLTIRARYELIADTAVGVVA